MVYDNRCAAPRAEPLRAGSKEIADIGIVIFDLHVIPPWHETFLGFRHLARKRIKIGSDEIYPITACYFYWSHAEYRALPIIFSILEEF